MERIRTWAQDGRGRLQRYVKLVGMNPVYYLGGIGILGGFAVSIFAIARDVGTIPGPALVVSGIGAIALVGQTIKDASELAAERRNLYIAGKSNWAPEQRLGVPRDLEGDGYVSIRMVNQQIVRSEAVDRRLLTSEIAVAIEPRGFSLVAEARRIGPLVLTRAFRGGAVLFNEPKARLASDLTAGSDSVLVQRTDYYSSLCTNEATGKVVRSRLEIRPVYDGWAMVDDGGRLFPLDTSPCSNHIGVSSIAITRDSQMLLSIQPTRAAQNADLLVPAASGSTDWDDVGGCSTLQELVRRAMERELVEECGLRGWRDLRFRTEVVGFARLIRRGGKPEFLGVTMLDALGRDVRMMTTEVGLASEHLLVDLGVADFRDADYAVIAGRLSEAHRMSVQLALALDCLQSARSRLRSFDEILHP